MGGGAEEAMGYNFRLEQVHWKSLHSTRVERFTCHRCRRDLPEDQFEPLHWIHGVTHYWKPRIGRPVPLHPYCNLCRGQMKGEHVNHPLYTPAADRFFQKLSSSSAAGARARGILFAVDKDDLLGLYLQQKGFCAVSGYRLLLNGGAETSRSRRALLRPSVDRISSEGNYVLGNIQIVAAAVNVMKGELDNDVFIQLCGRIADFNHYGA